jgi:3-dehydroquinate synthase
MKGIEIRAERDYEVTFSTAWKSELAAQLQKCAKVGIVISSEMRGRVDLRLDVPGEVFIFEIPDSEAGKSTAILGKLWDWLGAAGFTRSDMIVGIGGGATTDIAGFAAATWLRGISWVAVPTSIAGAVDAAIGGKTGANSEYGKNLIGAFHSPNRVIIDLAWFETLSDRDFAAGLAEVIKCGFIKDQRILEICEGNDLAGIRKDRALLQELIERSVQIKADVVSVDFKDSFEREILNYGHTFGHAVERHSNYSLRHGECVAIGMVFVAELAKLDGKIDEALVLRHVALLKKYNLPITYKGGDWNELLAHMANDKKSRGSLIRFVVLTGVGSTVRLEGPSSQLLKQSYERVSG